MHEVASSVAGVCESSAENSLIPPKLAFTLPGKTYGHIELFWELLGGSREKTMKFQESYVVSPPCLLEKYAERATNYYSKTKVGLQVTLRVSTK